MKYLCLTSHEWFLMIYICFKVARLGVVRFLNEPEERHR